MGLIPRSNHLSLIKDCYPPAPSSSAPTSEIPSPVSNALGKLSFYAVNRPKKLPKVLNVLLERATKDKHSSGTKARQDLGVTLDIIRGLVVECGENGKDGAGELIKAVAEEALRAAEMGLSGEGGVKGKKRDPEMEAKGASLFATIATLLSPPFFGLQEGFGKQYLRCLSLVSDLAQLKGPEAENSRFVALQALQAAARSDILYQTAGDFELQAEYLASALVANCYHTPVHDLRTLFNTTDAETGTSRLAGSLPSRKPPTITAPSSPPSQHDLASIAVPTLRSLARLSDSSQLLSLHNAISTFLNRHRGGELWHGNSQSFVEWLASSLLSASAPSYRPGVLGWWVDQVGEIYDAEPQHKSVTLLYVLASLLRGKTNLHGMGVGGVLNTLGELLIRRARVSNRIKPPPSPTKPINGTQPAPPTDSAFATDQHHVDYPQDRDLLTRPILSTISALSSKIYYADQLDNLISDLIDLLKGLRLEEGGGSNKEEKVLAATKLVVAMRLLLEEAHRGHGRIEGGEKKVGARERSRSRPREKEVSEATVKNGGLNEKEGTKLEDESLSTRPYLPPPVGSGETLKTNGLILGQRKSIENGTRPDEDFTIRGKKESVERPSIIVDDGARLGQSPTQPSPVGNRKRVSPRTFEKSLFILTVGDSTLRAEYVRATIVYLEKELDVRGLESTTTLPPDLAYFWKSLHSNCYTLATAPSLSATHQTPPATANPADLTHPLTRVRSQRSLRGLSLDSTISRPTINTNNLSPPTGPAAPFDYSSILRLLQAVHRLNSSTALLEGVPMLITLDRQAAEWETGSNGRERSGERAQATREVAAATITQIGRTWRINEVEQIGREALESTTPSVIPSFDSPHHDQTSFATRATAAPAAFNSQMIVDAIAFSDSLQSATGLDRTSLASLLGANWTPELASRVRSSSFVSPYVNGGASVTSRSVLQLPLGSSVRIPSNASTHNSTSPHSRGPGSLNTPSLADLQSSLGGGGGGGGGSPSVGTRSARQSQTPSLVSGNGGSAPGSRVSSMYTGMSESSPSKRRTNKMSAETLLASVGRRGRVGTNSSMSSQL